MSDLIVTNTPDTGFITSDYLTKIQSKFNVIDHQKSLSYGSAQSGISLHTYSSFGAYHRITTAFIHTDLESKQAIQQYFKSSPQDRKSSRRLAADSIKSPNSVFQVLEWGIKTDICDAYDAAVDLLAESSDVTLEVARFPALEHLILEKKVAILISGIARAKDIPLTERLKVVLQHVQTGKRMVKESIVDALFLLADETTENTVHRDILPVVKFYITWFASDQQPDKFIQRYARDIIDELS